MNTPAILVISILAGSVAAVGVTLAMQPGDTSTDTLVIGQLESSLQKLQADNQALTKRLDQLAKRPTNAVAPASIDRSEAPSVSSEQIAAAVEAYMSNLSGKALNASAVGLGGEAGATAFDLKKDLKGLLGTSFFEDPEGWKRAFEAGKMDEVIAEIEALAEANPNDPQSQMNQAVSYTFWPAFLGKGKDAISHFETLVKQQESMPAQDHEAQTYLYLGNMLAERDPARAREMWQKGMTRHPNSAELREKLKN